MNPPGKNHPDLTGEAEIDARYGLEPVLQIGNDLDSSAGTEFVTVHCPYCGEPFETGTDVSAGACNFVEDCQICCQPIEMELRVDEDGKLLELIARRGDS